MNFDFEMLEHSYPKKNVGALLLHILFLVTRLDFCCINSVG